MWLKTGGWATLKAYFIMYLKKICTQNQREKAYCSCSKTVNVIFRALSCADHFYSKNCADVYGFVSGSIHVWRLKDMPQFPSLTVNCVL